MTKGDLLRMRLRFILLAVVAAACILITNVHIRSVGGTFDLRLEGYEGAAVGPENLSITPEGMARIVDTHQDPDGVYVARIEGVEPGEGFLLVNLEGMGGLSALSVKDGPVVVADGINFNGWEALPISASIVFAVAGFICVRAVAELRSHAWYGYEMSAYTGGAIFCLVEAAIFCWLLLSGSTASTADFAVALTELATRFVYIMLIPMAIGAVLVCVSNVALIRYEGRRLTNLLGIAASIALVVVLLALRAFDETALAVADYQAFIVVSALDSVFSIGVCMGLAFLAGTILCAWAATRHTPSFPRDHVIILGCGLRADGTPTPILAGRVDAARGFASAQVEAGYPAPVFVPSGGKGADEVWAEAESMRRYLQEKGVDASRILLEDRSTNTRENLAFSAKVIADSRQGQEEPRVAFATTNYHVLRGYVYAHDAGLAAEGISAPTRLYFWPNAFLREFVGLLVNRAAPILAVYIIVAALYLLAEYAVIIA